MFVLNQINDGDSFSLVCSESVSVLKTYSEELDRVSWLDNSEDLEGDGIEYISLIWNRDYGYESAVSCDGYVRYEIIDLGKMLT